MQELSSLDPVVSLRDRVSGRANARPGAAQAPKAVGAVPIVARTEVQPAIQPKRLEQRLTVIPAQLPADAAGKPVGIAIPMRTTKRSFAVYIWFVACVVLPTALASVYYGYIASRQYIAEFHFAVRSASVTSSSSAQSGLLGMLTGASGSTLITENYMVTDFLSSREAVEELQQRVGVVQLYSKPEIDWWSRFNGKRPMEKFVDYWQGMISAQFDMVTGIATAKVRAFSPEDALLVAKTLVNLSESLVNKLGSRSQQDAVVFAKGEVEKAEDRLRKVQAKLTDYRNKYGVINPDSSVVASNSTLIQAQRANLAQLETQLATLLAQRLAPNAPAIVTLRSQIKSTREQLARTEADVGQRDDGTPLSTIVGHFEQLKLELQFAQSMVTSTMQALDQARANAAMQHLYISPYVQPTLPQSSIYPDRFQSVLIVAALAFAFWLIALMIVRSIHERFG